MENKFLSKKMMKSALIVEKPFRLEKILSLQVMYGKMNHPKLQMLPAIKMVKKSIIIENRW